MPRVSDDPKASAPGGLLRTSDLRRGADAFLRKLGDEDQPLTLVRDLKPHDLVFALEEADDEQRIELLALADRDQVQSVIDLTCWKGDHPDLVALGDLFSPLVMSGLDGAGKMLDDVTDELRTLFLKRFAVVHVRENKDDDIPAAQGSELIACPDGYYFVELPRPDDVTDLERQLLTALLNRPFEEYQRELECVRHDMPSELEELALRWRTARLADHGFEARTESLVLLAPRDPAQVERAIAEADGAPYPLRADPQLPVVFGANLEGREVLDRALLALAASNDPQHAERAQIIGAELGAMTSRFLTAIGTDLSDLEEVARGVRFARDTLALGLTAVAGADPQRGVRALLTQVPSVLVQAAMGLLAPLRDQARKLLAEPRLTLRGRPGALLDRPHRIAARGLARDLPLHSPELAGEADASAGEGEPRDDELEAFSDPAQVQRIADLLDEAELLDELLRVRLGFTAIPDTEGVTGSSLLLAALVNLSAGDELGALPLEANCAETFSRSFLEQPDRAAIGQAMAALAAHSGTAPEGAVDPSDEGDPLRRLLLRLVIIGRERIRSAEPLVFLPLVS
jgi:hypothetical protein